MAKKNILVFPCGSEIGLDIHQAVNTSTHFNLIGGSSVDDHGRFVYEDYIGDIPSIDSPFLISVLKEIVNKRKIDAIYPTMDKVIAILKNNEDDIGCKIIAPSKETSNICLSKEITYKVLSGLVKTPTVYDPTEKIPYPVFVKPKIGYGGRGTRIVHCKSELETIENLDKLLICELLPGEEYTVDCFTDRKGNLLYCNPRKRNRIKGGISVNTFFCQQKEEFKNTAQIINDKIRFRGAWFFQVKRDVHGNLCLLEIAARLGGSSLLSLGIGVNLALMTLFDAFEIDIEMIQNTYHIELDRALSCNYKTSVSFDSVYVDFDDCILLDKNSLNLNMISFLYKCVNERKSIFLLTKHNGKIEETLKSFKIFDLFDEIIHIDDTEKKSNYITQSNSIFIDDSFAERKEISERLNIPTFSPEMINVLL